MKQRNLTEFDSTHAQKDLHHKQIPIRGLLLRIRSYTWSTPRTLKDSARIRGEEKALGIVRIQTPFSALGIVIDAKFTVLDQDIRTPEK